MYSDVCMPGRLQVSALMPVLHTPTTLLTPANDAVWCGRSAPPDAASPAHAEPAGGPGEAPLLGAASCCSDLVPVLAAGQLPQDMHSRTRRSINSLPLEVASCIAHAPHPSVLPQVAADERFEAVVPPRFGLVCFRLRGCRNQDNVALLEAVNRSGGRKGTAPKRKPVSGSAPAASALPPASMGSPHIHLLQMNAPWFSSSAPCRHRLPVPHPAGRALCDPVRAGRHADPGLPRGGGMAHGAAMRRRPAGGVGRQATRPTLFLSIAQHYNV